ncbi:MAG: GNAT family N-acetyltransferase, partial [Actinobacteria bacterium]|nr:GNAT family N-acetyltransferase [Actinomycetota bacterium]
MLAETYRAARPEDVPEMVAVYLAASRDMYARSGLSAPVPSAGAMQLAYEHILSTGVFRVAESGGRIIAIAGAVLRDHLWFLSAFWALPEVQRQNIGMPLLREVWHEGAAAGATTFFTWASPDLTALASYMKLGMLPGYGIFVFRGIPEHLPPVPSSYQPGPLEHQVATALDLHVRGTRREVDHRFWAGPAGLRGRQVLRDGEVAGYYYL